MRAIITLAGAIALLVGDVALAEESGAPTSSAVDFERDIEPIFQRACVKCHGPEKPQGQLRLDAKPLAFQGGFSGEPIVPGKPDESLLFQLITDADSEVRMPQKADRLPAAQITLIRDWIQQGAIWPDRASTAAAAPEKHWAYVKPVRPAAPTVTDAAWVRNPIDAFVLHRLEQAGLSPSAEASKETLVRRLSLDLTGLPPTLDEIDAFLADSSDDAYEAVVDRLLASPHYGERWAQPWLDAARYADSNGFTNDRPRSIWPYRDWVINALNADMPFEQFTMEQIAGDLLPSATADQLIATGFSRNAMFNDEQGVDQGEARWNTLVERVGTIATVWLGSTLACAQCHNHKFDAFSQKDFYGMLAFFENTDFKPEGASYNMKFIEPILDRAPADQRKRRDALKKEIADLTKSSQPAPTGSALQNGEEPLPPAREQEQLAGLKRELQELAIKYPETLILKERPAREVVPTFLRVKGAYLTIGQEVAAATPAALHPLPSDAPRNRLTLAYWLASPENPLAARVMANRHWSQFFGRGIVETEDDFGTQGAPPSHPELLDWLACEFTDAGGSSKSLHKTIVMSATYRQSSRVSPALLERDPENRLLARGARFRLNAEFIRDVTLAASGLLSEKAGGPSVYPPQPEMASVEDQGGVVWEESQGADRYRRGLYTFWRRSSPFAALANFDAPTRESCTVSRTRTNTPLQALTLLNDETAFEAAAALAKRVQLEAPPDAPSRVAYAFRLCTARKPSPVELDALVQFYRQCVELQELDETAAMKLARRAGVATPDEKFAAWFYVAQAVLNLDETLTKE